MKRDETERLLQYIMADSLGSIESTDDPSAVHVSHEALSAFIDAELDDVLAIERYPDVYAHIRSCEWCRTTYEDLKKLLVLEQTGELVDPPGEASIDLSVLLQTEKAELVEIAPVDTQTTVQQKANSILWILNEGGQLIVSLSRTFVAGLQPSARPTFAKASTIELFEVTSPAIADDLMVTMLARQGHDNPTHCMITVTVSIPSRGGWPNLAGTAVTLALDSEIVEKHITDAFGKVSFAPIPYEDLSRLRVTVAPL